MTKRRTVKPRDGRIALFLNSPVLESAFEKYRRVKGGGAPKAVVARMLTVEALRMTGYLKPEEEV